MQILKAFSIYVYYLGIINAIKKILKQKGVKTEEYEHGKHKKEIEAAGVEGFPTLKFYPSNNKSALKYDGARTAEGFY